MRFKAVIFDFDGTLTVQGSIDFNKIKDEILCPEDRYILDYINGLPAADKKSALDIVNRFEYEAAETSREEFFVTEIIEFLQNREIPIYIITRNSRHSVLRALQNFKNINADSFYRIISRDDPFPVKPDPSAILHIAQEMKIGPEEILIVGDYIHDISAGINAGCKTAYKITNRKDDHLVHSDYAIRSLQDLIPIFSEE